MNRRAFLISGSTLAVATACGDTGVGEPAMDGSVPGADVGVPDADVGVPGPDGGDRDSDIVDPSVDWQLAEGHYEGYLPLSVVYPQPDSVTQSYARHRHAHPGMRYEIPVGVQFGKWPYRYELLEGPAGARVVRETLEWDGVDKFVVPEGYGVIAWDDPSAAASGPHTVRVRVYDQDHERPDPSFVDVEWTITVGSSQFVFVDTIGGNDTTGDGSIERPYREISRPELVGGNAGKIVVIRQTAPLDPDENSIELDPANTWSGGYVPVLPEGSGRPLTLEAATMPRAYIGYPGETVCVNMRGGSRFANVSGTDMFFAGITVCYTNQALRTAGNTKDITAAGRVQRATFWRLRIYRPFGGTRRDDNHGAIWFNALDRSPNTDSAHAYLYCVDCEGDRLNYDPHEGVVFGGYGSNGAHFFETYTASRTLVERNTVRNSRIINNLLLGPKGTCDRFEVRANDTTDGNIGEFHIRMLTYSIARPERGFSRNFVACYNKAGNLTNTAAKIHTGNTSNPDPEFHTDIYVYRNSMPGPIDRVNQHEPLIPVASHNVCRSVGMYVDTGNVTIDEDDLAEHLDDDMNLVGPHRALYLGTVGAEIA